MDPIWIGTVSALLGALVTGVMGMWRDHAQAKQQATRDDAQRAHDIDERRYELRREVYVNFGVACQRVIDRTDTYEQEHYILPGEDEREGPHVELIAPLQLIRMVGPDQAIEAAVAAEKALNEWAFCYGEATRESALAAVGRYTTLSRQLLKLEGRVLP